MVGSVSSKTFKEAFIDEDFGSHQKGSNSRFIRCSYIEIANKDWLRRSIVGKCRNMVDLHRIREEA